MLKSNPSIMVLRDVSLSLKNLILEHIPEIGPDNVSFESPSELEITIRPLVKLYLYKLMREPYLYNEPPTYQFKNGKYIETRAADPFQLLYMAIPYAKNAETELILANQITQIFYDYSYLEGDLLKGGLKQTGNQKIQIIPDQLSIDQTRNIWNVFPNNAYRLTLFYIASPVWIPSGLPKLTHSPVEEVDITIINENIKEPEISGPALDRKSHIKFKEVPPSK